MSEPDWKTLSRRENGSLDGITADSFISGVLSFGPADVAVVKFADVRDTGTRTTQVMMSESTLRRLVRNLSDLLAEMEGTHHPRQ